MVRSIILCGCVVLVGGQAVAAPPVLAGEPMVRLGQPLAPAMAGAVLGGREPHAAFIAGEIDGRVVKAAPYSANAVSETVQTLADGNRIVRSSSVELARDSEGRTRQQRVDGSVFINDPVAGRRYLLRPTAKLAIELPRGETLRMPPPVPPMPVVPPAAPVPPASMSGDEARNWAEAMRAWARELAARMRGGDLRVEADRQLGRTEFEPRVRGAQGPNADDVVRDVRIEVITAADAPPRSVLVPPLPPIAAPPITAFDDLLRFTTAFAGRDAGVTTSLGSRTVGGVRADGTRTTWTIAAGRIGNEKPIEIVSERWYAPDLLLVVESRHRDPRSGESSYRLDNIRREEPAADLFTVPAEYERRDRGGRPGGRQHGK